MKSIVAAAIMSIALPVLAQDIAIDKTRLYVSNPDACKAIGEKGYGAFEELDFSIFSLKDGIEGYEFHCEFFDVKSLEGLSWLFIEAICEEPGVRYPDTLSVTPLNETTIEISSSEAGIQAATNPDAGIQPTLEYTRCDDLTGIPDGTASKD